MILLALFLVSIALLVRLSERVLVWAVGLAVLAFALFQASLSSLGRAEGAVAIGALLLGGAAAAGRERPLRLRGIRLRLPARKGPEPVSGPQTGFPDLPEYEIVERVGVGGMANVYRAKRRSDGLQVALKIPQERYVADAKFIRRFHREAEVLRRLEHPNIIRVYDHNTVSTHYIAMEYVRGDSLELLLENRTIDLSSAVVIMRALTRALLYIHAHGIVHRDIKPGNVMIARSAPGQALQAEQIKLMDFGIAVGRVLTRLTSTGARVGTPIYMSPEQAKGGKVDAKSDIYSLGLVFYEMVTLRSAFGGEYEAVVHQQMFHTPPPPKQVRLEIPARMSELIMAMIDKDPERRPDLTRILEAIEGDILEPDQPLGDSEYLVVAVQADQGPLRVLDLDGQLRSSIERPREGIWNTPPTALSCTPNGELLVASELPEQDTPAVLIRRILLDGTEVGAFGDYGLGVGKLLQVQAIATAPSGDIYVLDGETCWIQRFSADGLALGRFGGRGDRRGEFSEPRQLACGPDGRIYILDRAQRQVQCFSRDGIYLSRLAFRVSRESDELRELDGLAVGSEGTVWIGDRTGHRIRQVGPDGKPQGSFALDGLRSGAGDILIAPCSSGDIYIAQKGGQTLQRYRPSGQLASAEESYAPVLALAVWYKAGTAAPEKGKDPMVGVLSWDLESPDQSEPL